MLDEQAELLFAVPERLLGLPAGGQVASERQVPHPAVPLDGDGPDLDRELVPSARRCRVSNVRGVPGSPRHLGHQSGDLLPGELRVDLPEPHAQELVARSAERLAGAGIDLQDPTLLVREEQRVGQVIDQRAEAPLARPQRLGGAVAFREVTRHCEDARAAFPVDRHRPHLDRVRRAVLATNRGLEREGLRGDRAGLAVDVLQPVRVELGDVIDAERQELVTRVAEHVAGARD